MKKLLTDLFKTRPTKEQSKDTGMAMVLLILLCVVFFKRDHLIPVAIIALVIDMVRPQLYRPVAIVWLGFSHLLGTLMSRIILTLVFFAVVTPIGVIRRLLGKDSLRLKAFKAGEDSVMLTRDHIFIGQDIETPY